MSFEFQEKLHTDFAQSFRLNGPVLLDKRSQYQHMRVFDTTSVGRVLVLDDIVQLTTRDECTYSEMLAHVPYFELRARGTQATKALIIGGGDGAVAEELLKHEALDEVVMAELDGDVIEAAKTFFADIHNGAFDNPRFTLKLGDGAAFVASPEAVGAFDIIIADRPDPVGPAQVLFADDFYKSVSSALTPTGIALFQTGVPFLQAEELSDTIRQLRATFKYSGVVLTVTPTYVGGFMALTWGSNGTDIGQASIEELTRCYQAAGISTDYYNPEIHRASLALPNWIKTLVD